MGSLETKEISIGFDTATIERGFWIYVARITNSDDAKYYYVGMTGDVSSINAGSVHSRFLSHLDSKDQAKGNSLFRNLKQCGALDAEKVRIEVLATKLDSETKDGPSHKLRWSVSACIENMLAKELKEQHGWDVIGSHGSKQRPEIPESIMQTYLKFLELVVERFRL